MLIYNHKKEFLGIDEKDLKKLGVSNLAALKAEAEDFADLFVKKPGYIHNFKHVHWIDFIACAESAEDSRALISINAQTFKCNITIDTIYLADNPDAPAFVIHLNNLRALRNDESGELSLDSYDTPMPKTTPTPEPAIVTPTPTPTPAPATEEYTQLDVNFDETPSAPVADEYASLEIDEPLQEPTITAASVEDKFDNMLDVGDISLDIDEPLDIPQEEQLLTTPKVEVTQAAPKVETPTVVDDSPDYVSDYQYDPSIASKELGLPLDLIEEFIQDFIDQAHDFKEGLYNALDTDDIDTVKILSHKLKGVAANLRIEDAHEVLAVINTTSDMNIVKTNLSIFYKIIAKLAGEEPAPAQPAPQAAPVEEIIIEEQSSSEEPPVEDDAPLEITLDDEDEEDFKLDFKDEQIEIDTPVESIDIEDSEVPQKIDMPELADDEFDEKISLDMDKLDVEDDLFDGITLDIDSDLEQPSQTSELETPEVEYSKEEVAREIGIDIESFNELFEDFVQESHTIFANINSAIAENDYQKCRSEALKLKGMSDNMRLHEFTNELEILIHSSDKDEIAQAIEKIEKTINKISKTGA